ncbi:MAG: hypothetical protein KH216_08440, partial [Clostridiales bacterium]|nr:hypothetical protein [Clostridiales bacterium]
VYLPLRETLTNIGTLNHTGSYITWDNGKIEVHLADVITETMGIADIEFSFEIGKPDFIIDPHGTPNIFFRSIKTSPILKDNLTYVPYSLMEPMMEFDTNNRVNNVGYTIFDKNGNIIEITSNQQTVIKTSQYDNTTPEYTVDQFFYLFSNGDFGNMKRYCTQNCVDNFFGDDYVFGMKKATPLSIGTVDNLAERGFTNGEWVAQVNVQMTPDENSVFDSSQTETSFYMILKQQDGRYLIDEFATGL